MTQRGFYRRVAQPLTRKYAPPGKRRILAQRICTAVKEYEELFVYDAEKGRRVRGVYDNQGDLVPQVVTGRYFRQDKHQRRLVARIHPKRSANRPRKEEIRWLVSRLATSFVELTNLPATYSGRDECETPFELFLAPIFRQLRITGSRDWIRDHIGEIKKAEKK